MEQSGLTMRCAGDLYVDGAWVVAGACACVPGVHMCDGVFDAKSRCCRKWPMATTSLLAPILFSMCHIRGSYQHRDLVLPTLVWRVLKGRLRRK